MYFCLTFYFFTSTKSSLSLRIYVIQFRLIRTVFLFTHQTPFSGAFLFFIFIFISRNTFVILFLWPPCACFLFMFIMCENRIAEYIRYFCHFERFSHNVKFNDNILCYETCLIGFQRLRFHSAWTDRIAHTHSNTEEL